MPSSRSFKTSRRNADADATVDFDIDGETFAFYPGRIPAAVLVDIPQLGISGDSAAMWELFSMAMGEGYPAFRAFLRDPERAVDADVIAGVVEMMVEEAAGRPTKPSNSS